MNNLHRTERIKLGDILPHDFLKVISESTREKLIKKFNEIYSKSEEVARLISGFLQYLLSKSNSKHQKPNKLKELNKQNNVP